MSNKRPLEANDLYRLRLISDPQIAPNGSRIAFVLKTMDEGKNDYISNIHVVDRNGTVVQFTSGNADSAPRWSPDGRYLAFLSRRADRPQVYLLPTSGGESLALTDLKLGGGIPCWSPDSTALAFTGVVSTDSAEEQQGGKDGDGPARTRIVGRSEYKLDGMGYIGNRRRHLFIVNVEKREARQLTDGDWQDDNAAWSPDGRHIAFASNRSARWDVSRGSDIYLVPCSGGEPHRLTSGGAYSQPIFSPDGSRIAFVGYTDPNDLLFVPARLYSVDRSGADLRDELGEWDGSLGNQVLSDVVLSAQHFNVPLAWRKEGIYFLGSERGETNIYCAAGAVRPVTLGAHTVTEFSMEEAGAIALACADATHPTEIFLRENGDERRLTHENDAFLEEVSIAPPQRIQFAGALGECSDGWLIRPHGQDTVRHPLIVYIHGGPMQAHGEAFFFEYQFLASHGFGVFYPNIHGSSSYGRAYQTSIEGRWGTVDYEDVMAGVEEAVSHDWVDPHRLGVAGGSYGGYMTAWVIGHTDRFRAAVSERCLCNIVSFMGTSDFGWRWDRMFGVYPEDDVERLWDMSPIKYVANVTAATLVMHSERDDRTPLEQGEQLFNALRRLGKETRLIVFPEESHTLTRIGKPARRVERLGYILDWFREHL